MATIIVVGTQWGDEGKGKVIDLLTDQAQHVVRPQGGNNAGHTIIIGEEEYKLHLIPSGILHPHTRCYLGSGVVIDPEVLLQEIAMLNDRGIDFQNRLWISPSAHVIFPYHRQLDRLFEVSKGNRSIGTTGRGIGPCYADKAHRIGIRMGEFVREDLLAEHLANRVEMVNRELVSLYGEEPLVYEELYREMSVYAEKLRAFVIPVEGILSEAITSGESMLLEGAQGTFLDIGCGTYPFVTSSQTIAGGVCAGSGIGPTCIDHSIGV